MTQTPRRAEFAGARTIEEVGVRDGCDLDLLLFFARHPRVVLSSEQLAAYVGYDLQQVARSLDLLVGTGLLRRSLNQATSVRLYVLETDRCEEWLEPLRRECATPGGRNALRAELRRRRSPTGYASREASGQRLAAEGPS
jgi:DNA-binding MarR family transcriptional regulator